MLHFEVFWFTAIMERCFLNAGLDIRNIDRDTTFMLMCRNSFIDFDVELNKMHKVREGVNIKKVCILFNLIPPHIPIRQKRGKVYLYVIIMYIDMWIFNFRNWSHANYIYWAQATEKWTKITNYNHFLWRLWICR